MIVPSNPTRSKTPSNSAMFAMCFMFSLLLFVFPFGMVSYALLEGSSPIFSVPFRSNSAKNIIADIYEHRWEYILRLAPGISCNEFFFWREYFIDVRLVIIFKERVENIFVMLPDVLECQVLAIYATDFFF